LEWGASNFSRTPGVNNKLFPNEGNTSKEEKQREVAGFEK